MVCTLEALVLRGIGALLSMKDHVRSVAGWCAEYMH